jgi:hypothetical protein
MDTLDTHLKRHIAHRSEHGAIPESVTPAAQKLEAVGLEQKPARFAKFIFPFASVHTPPPCH